MPQETNSEINRDLWKKVIAYLEAQRELLATCNAEESVWQHGNPRSIAFMAGYRLRCTEEKNGEPPTP